MIGSLTVRGPDERTHIFRLEAPGKYQHYSRPVWERLGLERLEDDGRYFSLPEVQSYIDSLKGNGPITEGEVEYIKRKVKEGLPDVTESGIEVRWDREIEEPSADPDRTKPTPQWRCAMCGKYYDGKQLRLSFNPGPFCAGCFDSMRHGFGFGY